jgi:hypothetical protein
MSAVAGRFGQSRAGASLADWLAHVRVPPEAWGGRRRLTVAAVIAAAVFGLGVQGWRAADLGGVEAGRAALDDAQRRVSDARASVSRLPAMRAAAALESRAERVHGWSSADSWRAISDLAAQSGLNLRTLEPAETRGEGIETVRPMRLTAQAHFAELLDFLQGLSNLPMLAVPADLEVKRDADALAIGMALNVFDALPSKAAQPSADSGDDDDSDMWFADPFAVEHSATANDAGQLRLVGMLRQGKRGLALLETAQGVTAVAAGESVGDEKVTRIDARGVTLANRGGARLLTLAEVVR